MTESGCLFLDDCGKPAVAECADCGSHLPNTYRTYAIVTAVARPEVLGATKHSFRITPLPIPVSRGSNRGRRLQPKFHSID